LGTWLKIGIDLNTLSLLVVSAKYSFQNMGKIVRLTTFF
jgi:hypothetical protein